MLLSQNREVKSSPKPVLIETLAYRNPCLSQSLSNPINYIAPYCIGCCLKTYDTQVHAACQTLVHQQKAVDAFFKGLCSARHYGSSLMSCPSALHPSCSFCKPETIHHGLQQKMQFQCKFRPLKRRHHRLHRPN